MSIVDIDELSMNQSNRQCDNSPDASIYGFTLGLRDCCEREASAASCSASFLLGPIASATGSPRTTQLHDEELLMVGTDRARQPVSGSGWPADCRYSCSADL